MRAAAGFGDPDPEGWQVPKQPVTLVADGRLGFPFDVEGGELVVARKGSELAVKDVCIGSQPSGLRLHVQGKTHVFSAQYLSLKPAPGG